MVTPADTTVVDAPAGRFRVRVAGGVLHASGVRYARAERFAPCEPVVRTDEVVDATRPGPACPQIVSRLASVTGPVADELEQSEDCLVLSVFALHTPENADPAQPARPVIVWIHGGAYVSGGGEAVAHDFTAMVAEQDVVVVSVTYRLGILGFLPIDGVAPANLGLSDILAALRWVHSTIAAFGGDPDRITAMGHSAGADALYALMGLEEVTDMLSGVILQSGPFDIRRDVDAMTAAMSAAASEALGDDPAGLSVDDVLAAHVAALSAAQGHPGAGVAYGPLYGHAPLPTRGQAIAHRASAAPGVAMVVGWAADDGSPYVDLVPPLARIAGLPVVGRPARSLITRGITRRVFSGPARRVAGDHRAAGGSAQTYRFAWRAAGFAEGACHSVELPFLMGADDAWSRAPMLGDDPDAALRQHGPMMRRHWADVARTGRVPDVGDHVDLP
ncbi:carboxylesterase family protein [Williamsia deligens]|uniref:Carboxylesterase family protein n=1 Tax=Williamsia deligens TaxID=321325 RepID=A0ABW3GBU0_9NOCA|nr:carboxylesterase family protein [Williamsia deligens]MCP2195513.1 para-nitrobenzyl esterase [Williamsia deligens]